jgi:hypothetical protein
MFIPDPDFCPFQILDLRSRITDPGFRISDTKTATKERDEKNLVVLPSFCSHRYHKIEYYFISQLVKRKIWANLVNLQRIIEPF